MVPIEFYSFFHIAGRRLVFEGMRSAGFEGGNHSRDFAASHPRRLDHGDRTMILFDHDLHAFLDSVQYGMNIAGKFGFCDADGHLSSIIAGTGSHGSIVTLSAPRSHAHKQSLRPFLNRPPLH